MVAESGDAGGSFDSFVEPAGEGLDTLRLTDTILYTLFGMSVSKGIPTP